MATDAENKTWKTVVKRADGSTQEQLIEAPTEEDAIQKFLSRKRATEIFMADGEIDLHVEEHLDEPGVEHYTREILIGLCEDGMTPMAQWYNRDSYSAHSQLGVAYALLKCEVPFRIEKIEGKQGTVWVEFYDIEGFNYHEFGGDEKDNYNTETAYIPTRLRLERNEGDWY